MKDQRVAYFRDVLAALLESLEATARLSCWDQAESAPEPLRSSASKLVDRLGVANRLAIGKFVGPARVVDALNGIATVIQRLDAAYVQFRQHVEAAPAERENAAAALETEIEDVKMAAQAW